MHRKDYTCTEIRQGIGGAGDMEKGGGGGGGGGKGEAFHQPECQ